VGAQVGGRVEWQVGGQVGKKVDGQVGGVTGGEQVVANWFSQVGQSLSLGLSVQSDPCYLTKFGSC
jgi:hypothetical protein